VDTGISKPWICLTNDLYLVKAADGRKIREGKKLRKFLVAKLT
jgi:hypothetical protein